jgi:hypothetical protein
MTIWEAHQKRNELCTCGKMLVWGETHAVDCKYRLFWENERLSKACYQK